MAKGLRIFYSDKNGNLYSPFGVLGALGHIPKRDSTWLLQHILGEYNEDALKSGKTALSVARAGEPLEFPKNDSSQGKHGHKRIIRFNDPDNIHDYDVLDNDAPHEGGSVILRSDPKHSVYGYMRVLDDMFHARDNRDEELALGRELLGKLGIKDKSAYEFPTVELYDLPVVLGQKFDDKDRKYYNRSRRYRHGGYGELAGSLYDINRMIYETENKGYFNGKPGALQLWKVEFDPNDIVSRDDIVGNKVTSFRDNAGDVAVRRMTPIKPLNRKKVDEFLSGYADRKHIRDRHGFMRDEDSWLKAMNSDDTGVIDSVEDMYRDLFLSMFEENEDIPSDRMLKNVYKDLSKHAADERRRNNIVRGVTDYGRNI